MKSMYGAVKKIILIITQQVGLSLCQSLLCIKTIRLSSIMCCCFHILEKRDLKAFFSEVLFTNKRAKTFDTKTQKPFLKRKAR